jgi:hypothetical protein
MWKILPYKNLKLKQIVDIGFKFIEIGYKLTSTSN